MRIRTIKPEFFLDDEVAALPFADRLLFIGLWCLADGQGILEERPRRIKASILPYDEVDVTESIGRLVDAGFLLRRSSDTGRPLLVVRTFAKHQIQEQPTATVAVPAPGQVVEQRPEPVKPRKPKAASPESDEPSPPSPHQGVISQWCERFAQRFGTPYAVDGGRDGKAVKKLLGLTTDFMDVATRAWNKTDDFACRQALTLHGLADYWNQINAALSGQAVVPAWKERNMLATQIKKHKANPAWIGYDHAAVTDADREALAKLQARLDELEAQP